MKKVSACLLASTCILIEHFGPSGYSRDYVGAVAYVS